MGFGERDGFRSYVRPATIRLVSQPGRATVLIALVLLPGCAGSDSAPTPAPALERDVAAAEQPGASAAPPEPAQLPRGRGHLLARILGPVLVHDKPGGKPVARLRRRTPFGKPRTLAVIETGARGSWLGVHSPVLGNDRIGWIANDGGKLRLSRTRVSLHVDLGEKQVEYRRGGKVVRRFSIGIGAAGTSTPPGRFQVTDKLRGRRFLRAVYGCCILALSARQPNLPEDWPGGDRIAIHGTPLSDSIGRASSSGCLRATDADLRVLMRDVPVGAPVFIRT